MAGEKLPWLFPCVECWLVLPQCSWSWGMFVFSGLLGRAPPWSGVEGYEKPGEDVRWNLSTFLKNLFASKSLPYFLGRSCSASAGYHIWGKHWQVIAVANSNVRVKTWNCEWRASSWANRTKMWLLFAPYVFFHLKMQWNVIPAAFITCMHFWKLEDLN